MKISFYSKYKLLRDNLKGYKFVLILASVGIILSSLLIMPIPHINGLIIDILIDNKKDFNEFIKLIILTFVLYFLRYIFSVASKLKMANISIVLTNSIKMRMINRAMHFPVKYFDKTDTGYLMSRISESGEIGNLLNSSTLSAISSVFEFIFSISIIFTINFKLSIFVLCLIPVCFLLVNITTRSLRKHLIDVHEANAEVSTGIFEVFEGISEVKILNAYNKQENRINSLLDKLKYVLKKQNKTMVFCSDNIISFNAIANLIIFAAAGFLIIRGEITIGTYTAFSGYSVKILGNIQSIASIKMLVKPASVSMERVIGFLGEEVEDKNGTFIKDFRIENIMLENIDFGYYDCNVLSNINLKIMPGDRIRIKGVNGSGKSTLIKLLLGFYSVENGCIYYNDIPIDSIDRACLRERIAVVSQNSFLFSGTVFDNIALGCNKKRSEVEKFLIDKGISHVLKNFELGLDTYITAKGDNISGGQRQFVTLIRALLAERDVIILDEPTANMDIKMKKVIADILKVEQMYSIIILISHDEVFEDLSEFREVFI